MKIIKILSILLCVCSIAEGQDLISEEISLFNGNISLPGTLSYQKTEGKIPLAIFIHGSGNIDRNGNQAGVNVQANYIKMLADSLNKNGIAFYRYDKRTANPANKPFINKTISFDDLVDDARVALTHFQGDSRFKTITVIGHSQGSLTAILALTDIASKYISLAGASKTLEETVISQITKQSKELGIIASKHFEELSTTDTIQEVNFMLQSIFNPRNHLFIKSYNKYNPIEEIKKVTIPTLIINGNADLQIMQEDAQRLKEAKPDAELVIIPEMNHVLKTVKNLQENQASYIQENFPLSIKLVEVITEFVKK
ncbi:alpha/beta hydrolase [Ascidiimonas sp. W6]|uniref:alpha/beta hydrolase n=1 Tax=Ascidiimonas meishanensis TaxID=3128903 RepID=UPI0030EB4EA6